MIAFVVVAAVFSYAVLGAGFFTPRTAQATVHTGVSVASSSIEQVGNIDGVKDETNNYLNYVNVTIALTAGGTPIDLSSMVVSYNDNNGGHNANIKPHAGSNWFDCSRALTGGTGINQEWCIGQKINPVTGTATSGTILDNNAQMIIIIGLPPTATPDTKITIDLQPVSGATLPILRTIPADLTEVQMLF